MNPMSKKAARGEILDARGEVLATNKTVCTISVIHSQIRISYLLLPEPVLPLSLFPDKEILPS